MKNNNFSSVALNAALFLSIVLSISSLLGAIFVTYPIWSFLLVVLGLVIGITHKTKEVTTILLVAITIFVISGSSLTVIPYIGSTLRNIVIYFNYFLAPAALVIAIRKAYQLLK